MLMFVDDDFLIVFNNTTVYVTRLDKIRNLEFSLDKKWIISTHTEKLVNNNNKQVKCLKRKLK